MCVYASISGLRCVCVCVCVCLCIYLRTGICVRACVRACVCDLLFAHCMRIKGFNPPEEVEPTDEDLESLLNEYSEDHTGALLNLFIYLLLSYFAGSFYLSVRYYLFCYFILRVGGCRLGWWWCLGSKPDEGVRFFSFSVTHHSVVINAYAAWVPQI